MVARPADKTIIEAIVDLLIHTARNAVDHGMGPRRASRPASRRRARSACAPSTRAAW
jgi:chemotaxis protein histidine kinase CheA